MLLKRFLKDVLFHLDRASYVFEKINRRFYMWSGDKYGLRELLSYPIVTTWYRYSKTLAFLDILNYNLLRKNISILEVGAGDVGITAFLPNSKFVYVASDIDPEALKHVKKRTDTLIASMSSLPLKEDSFNFIIGLACIDFIPKEQRAEALIEFKRVAKEKIVLESIIQDPEKGFIWQTYEYQMKRILEQNGLPMPTWMGVHKKAGYPKIQEFLLIFPEAEIIGYRVPTYFAIYRRIPFLRWLCGLKYLFGGKDLFSHAPFTNAIITINLSQWKKGDKKLET
jgi:ubiquinone/menaquinone biosynthesis C-methylase UbiE